MNNFLIFINKLFNKKSFIILIISFFLKKFNIGSFETKLKFNVFKRTHYAYVCYQAAKLAKKLKIDSISILEFGVAGGNGLVELEKYCVELENIFKIKIDIYGFDTGKGLPQPQDYRDLPYFYQKNFYKIDLKKINKRLNKAHLIIGDIKHTSKEFFNDKLSPIGAVFHDFDFYSSTKIGLNFFLNDESYFLPRVFCYFDDIIGSENELFNDFTGERLAINEFNEENKDIKISPNYYFVTHPHIHWHKQVMTCHFFKHSKYNDFIGNDHNQLPLN